VLPTLGENFGHAIFEALSAGRPVLISNQTPWHNLASQKIGWDISLDRPKEFVKAIEEISGWSQYDFDDWCNNTYNFAQSFTNKKDLKQQYKTLFT
jgi:glycosyltransferase involved in cell wall biosynthesis